MIATQRASLDEDNGLLARLEALHRLTAKDSTLGTAYFVLFLFITMIEILPVMVKFLQSIGKRSLYDDVLDAMDESTKDVARLSAAHERVRAEQEFAERERQEREATRTHIAKIIAAESEVLDAQIENWRTRELGLPPSPREPGQNVEVSMTNR